MEFLWILAGIFEGSLRDPSRILAGSLRNPCGIVSPTIPHYSRLPRMVQMCNKNIVFSYILAIWTAVKSPTIPHYFSCKDPARIPQGSHKDPARMPQDPTRILARFFVFLAGFLDFLAGFVRFLAGSLLINVVHFERFGPAKRTRGCPGQLVREG